MRSTRSIRSTLVAGAAVLTLGMAACGGDDDEDSSDTTAASEDTVAATSAPVTDAAEDTAADDTAATETATGDTATDGTGEAGGETDRDAYYEAGVESMGMGDAETGDCVINAVLDGFGVEAFAAAGTPEEVWAAASPLGESGFTADSPEVQATAEGIAACESLFEDLAASSSDDVSDEQVQCTYDEGGAEVFGQLLALQIIAADTSELQSQVDAIEATCNPETETS